ncbi:MAG: hypothetical protein B7Z08_09965 [Sphingomonadales bacterium 32-68-7]|nr:MAG: hypothetical protein B7Z33_06195 [Sphingomonadales bacterium 12-68-11]OYX08316.1 MAG: hypothetical protein B7Z08_09965 [Sphingomonadales bacterium 32-68-7]
MRYSLVVLGAVGAIAVHAVAEAQAPSDLQDLVGARGAGGETQLQARGYALVRTETGDDRVWTYWWREPTRTCVTVATVNGRYDSITISPAPDCRQSASVATPLPQPVPSAAGSRPGSDEHWFDLGLVCFGEGARPTLATRYGYTWDYDKGRYTYGNRTELSTQDFDASVTIQLWEDGGRIRLPDNLIPPIHSRGDHGWWELDNVSRGGDTIRASYRLNGLNKPTIVIDRRSGRISIRGASNYAFSGTCDTVDNQQRRF